MRVLAVASEAVPLVKTGGLADVVGSLPGALAPLGVRVTTMLPGYPSVMAALAGGKATKLPDMFGGVARLVAGQAGGLDLIALDAPHLFARPGNPYLAPDGTDWPDNAERFAAFGRAAAAAAKGFDVVHAHDWQAGLTGAYLRHGPGPRVPVVFTIHNLAFQGRFPAALFPRLALPIEAFALAGLEYMGGVGFMKAGLWYADRITTVSPTYAAEIRTDAGGMGFGGLLRGRADAVSGILNGLDDAEWNPATDPHLAGRFDAADPSPRAVNRAALQARLGLVPDPEAPLFGFVGRFTWQKGVDLILDAVAQLVRAGAQLVLLGSGDRALEQRARQAATDHPGRVGLAAGYDEQVARLIYGGADCVLVPSRFEPCGLTQLCALRYGAPPLVTHVGGLADTVIDANEAALAAGTGTGVVIARAAAEDLSLGLDRALALIADRDAWAAIRRHGMAADLSWRRSAPRYAALFRGLVGG